MLSENTSLRIKQNNLFSQKAKENAFSKERTFTRYAYNHHEHNNTPNLGISPTENENKLKNKKINELSLTSTF